MRHATVPLVLVLGIFIIFFLLAAEYGVLVGFARPMMEISLLLFFIVTAEKSGVHIVLLLLLRSVSM